MRGVWFFGLDWAVNLWNFLRWFVSRLNKLEKNDFLNHFVWEEGWFWHFLKSIFFLHFDWIQKKNSLKKIFWGVWWGFFIFFGGWGSKLIFFCILIFYPFEYIGENKHFGSWFYLGGRGQNWFNFYLDFLPISMNWRK